MFVVEEASYSGCTHGTCGRLGVYVGVVEGAGWQEMDRDGGAELAAGRHACAGCNRATIPHITLCVELPAAGSLLQGRHQQGSEG